MKTDDLKVCKCRPRYQAQAGPRGRRQTKTFPTKSAAVSWKGDTEAAFRRGDFDQPPEPAKPPAMTVREAAELWMEKATSGAVLNRRKKRYKPSTLRGYRLVLEREFYESPLASIPVDELGRGQINEFIEDLQGRGLASQTVRNAVVPLRAIFRNLINLDKVDLNPTANVMIPEPAGVRLRIIPPEEIPKYLGAVPERDRAVWATALYAGLRRGELMGLRWGDVDLGSGVITVVFNYDPGSGRMVAVKSEAGQDRQLPITGALREYLLEHKARAGARPTGLVFCRGSIGIRPPRLGDPHRPFTDAAFNKRAKDAWTTAKLTPFTLHDGRHTFASMMIAAMASTGTFDPKMLQTLMGHGSIQQTFDGYGKLFPGATEEAGRMLNAFLLGAGESPVVLATTRLLEALDAEPRRAAVALAQSSAGRLDEWLCDNDPSHVAADGAARSSDHPASVPRTRPLDPRDEEPTS